MPPATTPAAAPGRSRAAAALLVVGVAVIALNLRPALVAIGPLTEQLRADTGLGAAAVSLLTTLPLLCFGAFSGLAPRFARRVGLEPSLGIAVGLVVAGCVVRLLPPIPALFLGTAVLGTGIALANVLLPIVIKRDFPERTGPMMAVYSVMLNVGAALAAGLSVPLGHALEADWRVTLSLWGLLAAVALVLWAPQLRGRPQRSVGAAGSAGLGLVRSPLAWAIATFMGLQSLEFYSLTAWLPTLLHDNGRGEASAGLMVSLVSVTAIGASFVVPVFAARTPTQHRYTSLCAGAFLAGLVGLMLSPSSGTVLWMVALGIGGGTGISLALTLFVLRSSTALGAGELSGMSQAIGYTMAAAGPLIVGSLHGLTDGWTLPLLALAVGTVGLYAAGRVAGADRSVEAELPGAVVSGG